MTGLETPLVNLNGATREELIREHMDVAHKLREARIMMQARRPHGRDYQTSRTAFHYDTARKAFEERITMLGIMEAEFEAVAMELHEGGRK